MARFFKVEMGMDGWGLLANEGTAEEPKFRVMVKGTEWFMERLAADLNRGGGHAKALLEDRAGLATRGEGEQRKETNGDQVQG